MKSLDFRFNFISFLHQFLHAIHGGCHLEFHQYIDPDLIKTKVACPISKEKGDGFNKTGPIYAATMCHNGL